jgi:hypothetical protein
MNPNKEKDKILSWVAVMLAWLIAFFLAYAVFSKIKLLATRGV